MNSKLMAKVILALIKRVVSKQLSGWRSNPEEGGQKLPKAMKNRLFIIKGPALNFDNGNFESNG